MNKQDEQKARAIICSNCNQLLCKGLQNFKSCNKEAEITNCLEMAVWKKQQIIEKTEKWMKKNHVHYINTNIPTEQLIEDFKQSIVEE